MTGSRSPAEASGIQHITGHFATGYWRIIISKWRCNDGLFHCIYGTLRILYGTISHERLFSLIVDKIDWKYAWTIRLDHLDRAQQNSCVQAQNFQQEQEYSGREGKDVNLLLPHQKSASLKTRLKTSSRSLFSEKSKNPFIVETYNCTRLLAVKKNPTKQKKIHHNPAGPTPGFIAALCTTVFTFTARQLLRAWSQNHRLHYSDKAAGGIWDFFPLNLCQASLLQHFILLKIFIFHMTA